MTFKPLIALAFATVLAACTIPTEEVTRAEPEFPYLPPEVLARYEGVQDGDTWIDAVPRRYLTPDTVRQEVDYWTDEKPGTIVVDPWTRYLYLVMENDRALRYAVAVGEAGKAFAGDASIPYGREWPTWTPT